MAISKIGSKALVDCSVAATDIADGSITAAKLAGSIANAKLANSSITVNGTSVSLGASGSIPAVSWQSVITADGSTATSAVAGNGYFIDTTSNAHTINLPGSPSAGDTIAIKDYAGTFGTNNLTIGRNGNNIQGVANDSLISTNRASIILVYSDATKGWLYTVESNVADLQKSFFITATGGTVTTTGDYKIHTFTGDGCFVVSCAGGIGVGPNTVDYLVVAGGGSGGSLGGGGGAGGYRESHSTPVSGCYSASPLANPTGLTISATTYPITVGGGGAGTNSGYRGTSGSNSIFSTITSAGGGAGGAHNPSPAPNNREGLPGGSGGGGGLNSNPTSLAGTGNTPPTSPPQGNSGGAGNNFSPGEAGGGGGGATAAGTASQPAADGGPGGNGATTSISGSPTTYAGGGGGGGRSDPAGSPGSVAGTGGTGGGGSGIVPAGTSNPGTANTGGGGGGSGYSNPPGTVSTSTGGNGGKGIVIIRYKFQ